MSPPAAKRSDELVTVLLERLDRFESALSAVQQSLARMEAAEEQARTQLAQAHLRTDRLEARVSVLEALSNKAEGAAWMGKAIWIAGAGVAGFAAHWLAGR